MSNPAKVIGVLAATAVVIVTIAGCNTASGQSHGSRPASSPPTAPANGGNRAGNGYDGGNQGGNGAGNGGDGNVKKDSEPRDKTAPGIAVPDSLDLPCPGNDCAQPLTIRSTGTAPLKIYDMSVHDDSSTAIEGYHVVLPHACVDTTLDPGQSCTFYVSWYVGNNQSDIFTATLLIFDNVTSQPTYVGLTRLTTGPIVGS
jgi:hypothetical protein